MLLACIRDDFNCPTVDDFYLDIDRKRAREIVHYVRLVREAGMAHYVENDYADALKAVG